MFRCYCDRLHHHCHDSTHKTPLIDEMVEKKEKKSRVAVPRCPQQLAIHLLPHSHSWKPPAVAGRRSLHVRLPCELGWNTEARPGKRVNNQRMCSLRGANTKRHAMHMCWCTFLQLPRYLTKTGKTSTPAALTNQRNVQGPSLAKRLQPYLFVLQSLSRPLRLDWKCFSDDGLISFESKCITLDLFVHPRHLPVIEKLTAHSVFY